MINPESVAALLFDLGGVLIEIDFDRAFRCWERQSKLSFQDIRDRFAMDEQYEQHECGEINAAEYFNHLRGSLKLEGDDENIARGWNAIFVGEISQTLNDIRLLKKQIPCYAFTNSNPTHQVAWMADYPNVVAAFDEVFVSSQLGLRKPDIAAFEAIAAETGIALSEILFFDDSLQNVTGAQSAGLQAVHVRSPTDVKSVLERISAL
jgi:epoxide hydrolase-like predicted phosphatase